MKHKLLSALIILCSIFTSYAQVHIKQAMGWFESACITWEHYTGADMYNVYIKGVNETNWTQLDKELIRNYGYYGRADMVGLKAGEYQFKIEATNNGNVMSGSTSTSTSLSVMAYDRAGFAHLDGTAVGAYNNDGTLKANARVLYINNSNVDNVTLPILNGKTETTLVGLGNILKGYEKGLETRPLAIRFISDINMTSTQLYGDADALQIKGKANNIPMHITFEGIGNDAYLSDWGLVLVKSNNIEVRNLGIMLFNDDGISLKESVKVWVHNCDIFYGKAGSASDQAKGDGSLDTKDDSQYCTFSYNHFWDAGKMALCGMKSETGPNYMTYHHNWFDHSDSRHPRVRRMSVHVYNNYYDGISKYGIGATSGASIFAENNYFRNTNRPMMASLQGTDATGDGTFSGESGGMIKSYGNIFVECGNNFSYITANSVEGSGATAVSATSFDAYQATSRNEQVPSSYKTLSGGTSYDNFDTNNSLMYTYTPDAAIEVPAKVKSQAGRMQGGDFTWMGYNNATEDYNYDIINNLMNEVKNYKTSLIEISAFTQSTAAPATYTVTYYADVEGTQVYETMTGQTAIVYPQGSPYKEGYTFTGWSAIQGATIKGNAKVYPSFCDGESSTSGNVPSKEIPTFSYNATSVTVDLAATTHEWPKLNNTSDGMVRYESSNTTVATIDANGVVTPLSTGTTTIRASVDETDTYLSASAQYTLTVIDSQAPTYTVTYMVADEIFTIMEGQTVVVYPANRPVVSGHIFIGWDVEEGTLLTEDTVINAILETVSAQTVTLKAGSFPNGYTVDGATSGSLYTYSDNTKTKEVFTLTDGEHTVTLPEGIKATKIVFYGCAQNNESRDGIIDFNGTSQSTTFTNRKSAEFTTITFENLEITDSFTFTLGYKSAIKIYIDVEPYDTAIDHIEATEYAIRYQGYTATSDGKIYVYNLQGRLVASGIGIVELHSLPSGIYLVRCGNEVIKVVR